MITRYTRPQLAALWSDATRYETWVRVEVLACEAQVTLGHMPADLLAGVRRAPIPCAAEIAEAERTREHEVLSFLAVYCATMPPESARWVHLGMTSYDLVDTALGYLLGRACDLVLDELRRLRRVLVARGLECWNMICIGRTHGMHAEPTTFGHKLAGFAFAIDRCVQRLIAARETVCVGTVSGSVGTYALIDPQVETYVCRALGLAVEPAPSQVVARDRHAQLVQALATLGACIEQIALELRLLQRSEVREVEERRSSAYQGSSAMPHKRNPTNSERLCGLARLLRGYASMSLENVALWHERDLSHSSVERVVLPDATTVAHYLAHAAAELVETLDVFADRMQAGIDRADGTITSSAVLADLLRSGADREHAYRSVQAAALTAATTVTGFGGALQAAGIQSQVPAPERFLLNHDVVRTRLEQLRDLDD